LTRLVSFGAELRRRHVVRVGGVYVVVAFLSIQAADLLFPALLLPDWAYRVVVAFALVGLPIALVLAWAFDITPSGIQRTPGGVEPMPAVAPAVAVASAGGVAGAAEPALAEDPVGREGETAGDRGLGTPWKDAPEVDPVGSIVVLPFTNISSDRENEYFSDGLTEEIISDLSQLEALRVISRTSAMRLKGTDKDVRTLARELNVRYVLEGSVRKTGDRLRMTAQLIDAHADSHLWTEKFDGTVEDVFAIQERVARAIAEALRIRLGPRERQVLAARPIADVRAHESYLRARHEARASSEDGLDRARRHIENAMEIVGQTPLLCTTLGHIHLMYLEAGVDPDDKHLAEAEACAEAAFAVDPDSPRGHWIRGYVHFFCGRLPEALAALGRARHGASEAADILLLEGYIFALVGRTQAALERFERALALDPLTPLTQCMPGFVAALDGRFADAVDPYRRFHDMDPENPFAHWCHAWVLSLNGRIEEAGEIVAGMGDRFPHAVFTALAESLHRGLRGAAADALAALTPDLESAAQRTELLAREVCHCYAVAGERERALAWLERAVGLGLKNHTFLARHDPFLAQLRGDPRFEAIVERVRRESSLILA
jgi:eukaryotic-like serine/threonine-protein kinase